MRLLQNNKKEFVLGRHHTNLHYTFGRSFCKSDRNEREEYDVANKVNPSFED